jgi:hypothetical protein
LIIRSNFEFLPKSDLSLNHFIEGDHFAAFPVNRTEDVDLLLTHLTGIPGNPDETMLELQEYKDGQGWYPVAWGQSYKTFYGRNLQIFVIR